MIRLRLPARARILVTRTDRMGDLILSTPVFQALKDKYPDARLTVLTFTENRELVEGNPFIDEVLLYDKRGSEKGLLGNLLFARRLARKHFDAVIHLHATNRMHAVTWLARIPVRIGWSRRSPWMLTHAYPDIKTEGRRHESVYNFHLLADFGVSWSAKWRTYFPLTDRARISLHELLANRKLPLDRPLVILNPSASCPSKRWPARRFSELARRVSEKYGAVPVLIGGPADAELSARVARECESPVYDLTGLLNLSMLGALIRLSALLISNDTGPVHIASALEVPVISIFGRNQPGLSPKRWGPLGEQSRIVWKDIGCDPCLAHKCRINFLCLDVISSEDVLMQADSFGRDIWEKLPDRGPAARAEIS